MEIVQYGLQRFGERILAGNGGQVGFRSNWEISKEYRELQRSLK